MILFFLWVVSVLRSTFTLSTKRVRDHSDMLICSMVLPVCNSFSIDPVWRLATYMHARYVGWEERSTSLGGTTVVAENGEMKQLFITISLLVIGSCYSRYLTSYYYYPKKETRTVIPWIRPIYFLATVSLFLISTQVNTEGFFCSDSNCFRIIGIKSNSVAAVTCTVWGKKSVFSIGKDTMKVLEGYSNVVGEEGHEVQQGDTSVINSEASKKQEILRAPAPLYITVGPQCSGKTTVLAKILGSSNTDVSIDAQTGVYYPIPLQYALIVNPINMTETERAVRYQRFLPFAVVNQTIHGSTLQQRVLHPSQYEMHLVLQRLCGRISADAFRCALKSNTTIPPPYAIPTFDLREELIHSVEQTMRRTHPHPAFVASVVDLFVVEAIFKGGGLQSAQERLLNMCIDETTVIHPIAWGNTNTRPREYEQALKAAEASGRPVYFIVYGHCRDDGLVQRMEHFSSNTTATTTDHGGLQQPLFLPVVSRFTLLQRNIERFCATGRYINVKSIHDAIIRTEDLITKANNSKTIEYSVAHTAIDATFQLHSSLAKMAGFHLCPKTRTVSSLLKVEKVHYTPRFNSGRYGEMNTSRTSFSDHQSSKPNNASNTYTNSTASLHGRMNHSNTAQIRDKLGNMRQQSTKRYNREDFPNSPIQSQKKRNGDTNTKRFNGSAMQSYKRSGMDNWKRQQPNQQNNDSG
jgi:hypothetical protein